MRTPKSSVLIFWEAYTSPKDREGPPSQCVCVCVCVCVCFLVCVSDAGGTCQCGKALLGKRAEGGGGGGGGGGEVKEEPLLPSSFMPTVRHFWKRQ